MATKRSKRAPAATMTTLPRRRALPPERRAQLLALGLDLFTRHTYDEVSIDEVARLAGISKGLLYHYFSDKRAFYIATVEAAAEMLLARTHFDEASAPAVERLRLGVDAYLEYVEQHGPAFAALMRGGVGVDPDVTAIVERAREVILDRLIRGSPDPLPPSPLVRLALRGWIGLAEATIVAWVASPNVSRDQLCNLLCQGLVALVGLASDP